MRLKYFKKGMKDGIPILLGYFAVSFTFGMMAVQGGLSVFQSVSISFLNLTSAGQFAGLDIILAAGSLWEMALTQLVINLRYMLMSFSVGQKLDKKYAWWHRFGVAFGMTDEIFAITMMQNGAVPPYYVYGAMAVAVPGWTLGTLAGALAGQVLPDMIISALGIAIYGMFLAIIIPPARKNSTLAWVILGAMALSSAFKYIPGLNRVSSGFVIIIVTVVVAAVAAAVRPIREEHHE
ncbi:MAG: AzlC family ABC transporter permease [Lachnospiraceae bacterium]|nr:AzlC family ABC transporter permease [Lachnospiraceae bacterium]MBR6349492.1 AzlC family ABC transporter permease [Lachnospiraceae bacterium]